MLTPNRVRVSLFASIVALAAAAGAFAKGLDDFSLTKAIPSDVFVAIHTRGHDGQAWLNKQFARLAEEAEKARFDRDFKRMFKKIAAEEGEDAEKFDEHWQKVSDLLAAVEWFKLADREYAFCMRFGEMMPEFVSLMMPATDKVGPNFDGLAGLMKNLASLDETKIALTSDTQGDTTTHRLSIKDAPFPVVVTLARHKDVIVFGFGPTLVEQSLALLGGKEGKSLASTPRFQEAFKKIAVPTDAATFVDQKVLFRQGKAMVDQWIKLSAGNAPKEGEPGYEDYARGVKIPGKLFDMMDIFEYSAGSRTTDGMKTSADQISVLRDDAKGKLLYQVMFTNPPLKNPLNFVPKECSDFSVSAGINVKALWDGVVKMLKEDIPEGEEALAGIEEMKKEGFDIEKDLLSWIQGGFVTLSQPGPNQYAQGDMVFMLKVSDEAKAKEQLDKLVAMVEPMMGPKDQASGSIAPATIEGAEGFRTVNHQMLAMMGGIAPTFGVHGGWMIIGTNPKFIEKSLATAAGKSENVSKSERFQKEGLAPGGDVLSVSWSDTTKLGENLGTVLGMLPMATMGNPELAKNPAIDALVGMAPKIGRVLRKLDFLQSSASISTMESGAVRQKSLTNYREPPAPPKKPSAGDSSEKSESKTEDGPK